MFFFLYQEGVEPAGEPGVWITWRRGKEEGTLDGFVRSNWLLWLSPSQVTASEQARGIAVWMAEAKRWGCTLKVLRLRGLLASPDVTAYERCAHDFCSLCLTAKLSTAVVKSAGMRERERKKKKNSVEREKEGEKCPCNLPGCFC